MSARVGKLNTIIFDTNTNFEPIHLCVGQRCYRVEDERSLRYLLFEENGKGQLKIENKEDIPLKRVYSVNS